MARTYTFTVTVAEISAGSIYGYDAAGMGVIGAIDPDPAYYNITDGLQEDEYQIYSCAVYTSGIEFFTDAFHNPGPYIIADETYITEVRLQHSGGTLVLGPSDWSGSKGAGYLYLFYINGAQIWTAADIGQQYTVEFDTNAAPAGPPPPGDPDYNQGTVVNTGPQTVGGGKGGRLIAQGDYTTTQTAEVRGGSGAPGGGDQGGAKGGGGKGGSVIVNVPDQAGAFDVTPFIEGYDFGSGTWYTILQGAQITAGNGQQRLRVQPGITEVANASANDLLPYMWRVRMEHGDATEITYSVSFHLN